MEKKILDESGVATLCNKIGEKFMELGDMAADVQTLKTNVGEEIGTPKYIIARYPMAARLKSIMGQYITNNNLTGTYYGYCLSEGKFYSINTDFPDNMDEATNFAAVGDVIGIYDTETFLLSGLFKYIGVGELEALDTLQARCKLAEENDKILKTKCRDTNTLTNNNARDIGNLNSSLGILRADVSTVHQDIDDFNSSMNTMASIVLTVGDTNTGLAATNALANNNATAISSIQTALATKATIWSGTQSQYDAITTKDANTLYLITE